MTITIRFTNGKSRFIDDFLSMYREDRILFVKCKTRIFMFPFDNIIDIEVENGEVQS